MGRGNSEQELRGGLIYMRPSLRSVLHTLASLLVVMLHIQSTHAACDFLEVGNVDTDSAFDVEVVGSLAYVAESDDFYGVRIVDVSNPTTPTEISSFPTPDASLALEIVNNLAFVAARSSGLRIFDISNPLSPVFLGTFNPADNWFRGLRVLGCLAYVADGKFGLRIIDVSNPSSPTQIGSIPTPNTGGGRGFGVDVVGTLVYLADGNPGVRIIDSSNPAEPSEIGRFDSPGKVIDVDVIGTRAYVLDQSRFLIVDVSEPSAPQKLGSISTGMENFHIDVSGNLASVAQVPLGLRVFEISEPANILEVAPVPIGDAVQARFVGDLLYVASGREGLRIFSFDTPCSASLLSCEANLGQCVVDLNQCLEDPRDADSDGEADVSDLCPDSVGDVDSDGCTLQQFCEGIDISTPIGKQTCRRADWRNDEPLYRAMDCTLDKGAIRDPTDDRCVVR